MIKNFFYRMLCGAFLGVSVIAPGVSGSIMAVMLGIYDELIGIISNPFKKFKKNVIYLLPMVIGAGISMLLLLKGLRWLFANYEIPAFLLFISLIAGSIPTVYGEAKKAGYKNIYFIGTVIALCIALTVGLLAKNGVFSPQSADPEPTEATETVCTSERPDYGTGISDIAYYSISSFVAGMTSMVPGMSVSMMLMMFSVYEPLLAAASGLDFKVMIPVGLCFIVGMVLFSNVSKRIFEKKRGLGFLLVLGFMTGSMIAVFPRLPERGIDWALSAVAVAIGVGVSVLFRILGKKFKPEE